MSKVSRDTILESVNQVLELSKAKERKFLETIELQVNLKNYDPQKEKRFSGKLSCCWVIRVNELLSSLDFTISPCHNNMWPMPFYDSCLQVP